jgi:VanZ family protein
MNRTLSFRIAAITVLIAIWTLSLLPAPDVPKVPGSDKLHHFLAYFTCMFCWGQLHRRAISRLRLAIGFAAMGALNECVQYFTPTRSFEYMDMVANAAGVAVAWFVVTVQLSVERRLSRGEPTFRPPQ